MVRRCINKTVLNKNEAISDIVGTILMVMLVVVGIGAVSVVITSQNTPENLPSVTIISAVGDSDLFLYHYGGDSLDSDDFIVRVDGVEYSPEDLSIIRQGGNFDDAENNWDYWGAGDTLVIPDKSDFSVVQIISTEGSEGSVIAVNGGAVYALTAIATITPIETATSTPTVIPKLMKPPVADLTADTTS